MTDELNASLLEDKLYKLRKKIPADVVQDIDGMDAVSLRQRISTSEVAMHEADIAMKSDTELQTMKEQMKEMTAPFREIKALQSSIARYAAIQLVKRGQE